MAKHYSREWAQGRNSTRIVASDMAGLSNDQLMRIVDAETANSLFPSYQPGDSVRAEHRNSPAVKEAFRRGLLRK